MYDGSQTGKYYKNPVQPPQGIAGRLQGGGFNPGLMSSARSHRCASVLMNEVRGGIKFKKNLYKPHRVYLGAFGV